MHPAVALLSTVAVAAALVWLLRPVHGGWWRWSRVYRSSERVQVEDALKHLHDCEYRGHPGTLESLTGALSIPPARAAEIVGRVQHLGLVTGGGGRIELTDEGRTYALRVIRVHRLWERYLSERTGFPESEWHAQAEHREHITSADEARDLAEGMGFPRYDPHGDPIPTEAGEIPPQRGLPLSDLDAGQIAEIVHVEDEPHAVYAQLVALRLTPGVRLRVLESSPARVRFATDTDEHLLAPVVAANVTVMPLTEEQDTLAGLDTLTTLEPGERARVVALSPACRGAERRRILDLGMVPGTVIEAEMPSPGGDPMAYRVRGALIALRRDQADLIHVERAKGEAA